MTVTMHSKDARALSNESAVYKVLQDSGRKMTVNDIHSQVADQMTDRTVRRAITSLRKNGFVKPFGKDATNATLYGVADMSYVDPTGTEEVLSFGGELVTVKDFFQVLSSPEVDPLKKDGKTLLARSVALRIRRAMLFAVISSGETGQEDQLRNVAEGLMSYRDNLRYVLSILDNFVDSPVWYDQYRDQLAYQIRKVIQDDPELFKLVIDFVRSES